MLFYFIILLFLGKMCIVIFYASNSELYYMKKMNFFSTFADFAFLEQDLSRTMSHLIL